jgi:hypothetical protein
MDEANTTIVNVDRDTSLLLSETISRFIGGEDGASFCSECEEIIRQGNTSGFIQKILETSDVLFNSDEDSDTESIFQALVSCIFALEEKEMLSVVSLIVSTLTSKKATISVAAKTGLRLKILVSLFNLVVRPTAKYIVLRAVFSYANDVLLSAQVADFHNRIEDWATSWKLSIDDQSELFLLVAKTLELSNRPSDALIYLVKYLGTFAGTTLPVEAQKIAIDAVINAIKAPASSFKYRSVLYESLGTQSLGGEDLTSLVELLGILCSGDISEYSAFAKGKGAAAMDAYKINQDSVLYNIRLLSLCSLCASRRQLGYAEVASGIGVAEEDVEEWLVTAADEGLVEVSIDQSTNSITVARASFRKFEKEQWVQLRENLFRWHEKMSKVVDTLG